MAEFGDELAGNEAITTKSARSSNSNRQALVGTASLFSGDVFPLSKTMRPAKRQAKGPHTLFFGKSITKDGDARALLSLAPRMMATPKEIGTGSKRMSYPKATSK